MEGEFIIGVQLDGQSVTLEPGGQFELSGAPVETIHQTCAEVNSHLYQVRASSSIAFTLEHAACAPKLLHGECKMQGRVLSKKGTELHGNPQPRSCLETLGLTCLHSVFHIPSRFS